MVPLVYANIPKVEAVGYAARCVAVKEAPNFTLTPFLIQTLLILLAPALMAASIYMVLGRLIRLLDAHEYAIVRTTWLTKIFVVGDVLSFMTQSAGMFCCCVLLPTWTNEWVMCRWRIDGPSQDAGCHEAS